MTFYHPGDKWRWQTDHFGGCETLHSQNLEICFLSHSSECPLPPLPLRQIGQVLCWRDALGVYFLLWEEIITSLVWEINTWKVA
jgi:hypothetical protein